MRSMRSKAASHLDQKLFPFASLKRMDGRFLCSILVARYIRDGSLPLTPKLGRMDTAANGKNIKITLQSITFIFYCCQVLVHAECKYTTRSHTHSDTDGGCRKCTNVQQIGKCIAHSADCRVHSDALRHSGTPIDALPLFIGNLLHEWNWPPSMDCSFEQ